MLSIYISVLGLYCRLMSRFLFFNIILSFASDDTLYYTGSVKKNERLLAGKIKVLFTKQEVSFHSIEFNLIGM